MDCMTISTFRNLERQAIQQSYKEVFTQKHIQQPLEPVLEPVQVVSTQPEGLNYYA